MPDKPRYSFPFHYQLPPLSADERARQDQAIAAQNEAEARIVIRFIGRKGRRGRIAIEAPAGAVFDSNPPRSM